MSAVQSQQTLWSCSFKLWPCPLSAVFEGVGSLYDTDGSQEWYCIKITFKCHVFCVLCTSACRQSFPRLGELSWLNVKASRLYLISALPPNWSCLLYLYWPWRGVQTLDLVMLTPQDGTDPGSWESHPNSITVHRQSGWRGRGLLSGDPLLINTYSRK